MSTPLTTLYSSLDTIIQALSPITYPTDKFRHARFNTEIDETGQQRGFWFELKSGIWAQSAGQELSEIRHVFNIKVRYIKAYADQTDLLTMMSQDQAQIALAILETTDFGVGINNAWVNGYVIDEDDNGLTLVFECEALVEESIYD